MILALLLLSVFILLWLQKIPLFAKLLILFSSLLLSATMLKSGLLYPYGLAFWGPNGHDAIWHLAVINQLKQNIPPLNPIFSGFSLNSYHWGFDLLSALISKISRLSSLDTYFRFLPLTMAIFIGLFSYKFIKKPKTALIFVFLNYFAGSFGWLVTLLRSGQIGGESLFWSMQSASTLINPPYALSLVLLLSGLYLWQKNQSSSQKASALLLGLYFSLLTGIKIYAAILVGLTFSLLLLFKLLRSKAHPFDFLLPASMAFFSALVAFFLRLFSGASLLQFKPFWFVHSLVESLDKLYLPRLAALRFNLSSQIFSFKLPLFLALEIFFFGLFLFGNLGFRSLGFKILYQKIKKNRLSSLDQFVSIFMILALAIPTLFVQKGTAWNTIQFFYYFLLFANYYFAHFLSHIKSNILLVFLLLLTSVTSYATLKDYFGSPSPSTLPLAELQALDFLQKQKPGIVLTYPYDAYLKKDIATPLPLYIYETTAYVSAFSSHQSFLEDEMNLTITGFDWPTRRQQIENFFQTDNVYQAKGLLLNNQIDYVYLLDHQLLPYSPQDLQLTLIYDQAGVKIYQVQR